MLVNIISCILANEEVAMNDVVMGNTILIFDDMVSNTTSQGKPFFLDSSILYRIPIDGDKSKIKPVVEVENKWILTPEDYMARKAIAECYLNGKKDWNSYRVAGAGHWKITELDNREAAEKLRNKYYVMPEAYKISELVGQIFAKKWCIDLEDTQMNSKDQYVLSYTVYYDLNKKKQTFFSEVFTYNEEGKYCELGEKKSSMATSWWAICLYTLAGVVLFGIVIGVCCK